MQSRPGEKDIWFFQNFGRGRGMFAGRITPKGERKFYFRYTDTEGKRRWFPIGSYHPKGDGGLRVKDAANKAKELSETYAEHRDLREFFRLQQRESEELQRQHVAELERQRIEAEEAAKQAESERQRRLTVRQLFERWADTDLKYRVSTSGKRIGRKDSGEYTRQQFERHIFPSLGDRAVVDVTRADLMAIFDHHSARGAARTVGVLFSDMKQMLRFAVLREIIPFSPLAELRRADVGGSAGEVGDRFLSDEEIFLLATQLPQARLQRRSELAIWILLATACRIGELMRARWDEIDFKNRTWLIPEENSKNDREHLVHLSPFALRQLKELFALREAAGPGESTPWLFPSRDRTNHVEVGSLGDQLSDRQRRSDDDRRSRRTKSSQSLILPGGRWTAHDLRRTAASVMGNLGIIGDVIDECLNHMIEKKVRRTYIQSRRWKDQARAFDRLGYRLEAIVRGELMPPST